MDIFSIIYTLAVVTCCIVTLRYDIQMFQLNSYRYSRYFRWLVPGNIISEKRFYALLVFVSVFLPMSWGLGFATSITLWAWVDALREKFKTPLVYTTRVKRLFATNIILFAAIIALALLFAGE